ncbi:MAG: hypothetical protein WBG86_05885, partial [Polyangiales bacterium]
CVAVRDDDPAALAEGARWIVSNPECAATLARSALDYLERHHDAGSFDAALRHFLAGAEEHVRSIEQGATHAEAR